MNTVQQTLSKHLLVDGYDFVMDMEKSHDFYIKDAFTGEEFLDMFSMFASASIGYNHPHLVANTDFLGKMAVIKPSISDVYNKEFAQFMETFERVAMPAHLQYAFFVSGGALAVENALKVAFDWKTRKNISRGETEEADIVIHFKQAFHGRSGYTMSLTNTADPRKYMYFPKFDWPRVTNPKLEFPHTDENLDQTILLEDQAKAEIEAAYKKYGNRVACVIVETLQGEGGDNFFRKEFHQYLREVTEKSESLLIYDEVQCGMGITGKMWAHEHYGIIPDVISFGKKTQVCGVLANKEKMDQVPQNVFKESSRINSTFGGNFIDFMRLKLILEVYEKENLVENAAEQGEYLKVELLKLQAKYPNHISNTRGLGLWCAFDMKTADARSAFMSECYKNKLLMLTCGTISVRFRPHMNIDKATIDEAITRIDKSLAAL